MNPSNCWFWGYSLNPLSCWFEFSSDLPHCWFVFPSNPLNSWWTVICCKGAEEVVHTFGLLWYSEYGLSSSSTIECFSVLFFIIGDWCVEFASNLPDCCFEFVSEPLNCRFELASKSRNCWIDLASKSLNCWFDFASKSLNCWFEFALNSPNFCGKAAGEVVHTLGLLWYSEFGLSSSSTIECFSILYTFHHWLLTCCGNRPKN